ncbi:hypothetical protein COT98_00120 [Candidatus Falkowbacteria bacterium CG10_big_fil_rev_8_21_14_0_10_39_9]|uniref:Type II secretion system protein GspG C-terminal domain-containing protein n=1 Tax=Candidatus Falkowbacteria bacterium CG10_big_fil_rev_8_21_14_0_10_39_9 TaxID=1974566 RepID=A0A2M6WRN4_9BACT|nr:MAG: hypothetical protein COT98_00120 [Candidatus Falkowbacteria bacterium CG10_big_fil_rev_8_21_14_0_10_39_9]
MINQRAFTVLQMITAFFMIGLLIVLIILIIDPQRQLAETRNARRVGDSEALLSALNQYVIDHNEVPLGIDGDLRVLGTDSSGCDINCWDKLSIKVKASGCLDLQSSLIPKYLINIPTDPLLGTNEITYYAVRRTSNNRLAVYSCAAELSRDLTIIQ